MFVRRELKSLRRASRESTDDCCCDKCTTGGDARTPVHLVGPFLATMTRAQAGLKCVGSSTSSAEASTGSIESESATNRWAIWSQMVTRNSTFVMPILKQDVLGQNVQSALPVIAPLPLISFIENRVGARRSLYSRCFAHDLPDRGSRLFDPAQIARSHA